MSRGTKRDNRGRSRHRRPVDKSSHLGNEVMEMACSSSLVESSLYVRWLASLWRIANWKRKRVETWI